MTKATILIPDISGFTAFLTETEIKHSSHIINELLENIIQSNRLGFHLSEVEGDAVLFYKKGDALPKKEVVEQCKEMFTNFHRHLKAIERDSVCRCGACTSASNLTLKFIVHFGSIQEISIANFLKATGTDMVVAHRLVKNKLQTKEYLLLSKPYLDKTLTGSSVTENGLEWLPGSEEYASIGKVDFEYTHFAELRKNIPDPPPIVMEQPPVPSPNARQIFIDMDVPMLVAYQNLIDTDKRNIWVIGMTKLERDPMPERAGFKHYCLTEGIGLDHTIVSADFQESKVTFIEQVIIQRLRMKAWTFYKIESLGERRCRLSMRLAFRKTSIISRLVEHFVLKNVKKDFEAFKAMCESA
jgi:hypothetical protein